MQDKYPKILLLAGWYPHSLNEAEGDFIKYQAKMMSDAGVNLDVLHSSMTYKYALQGQIKKRVFSNNDNGFLEVVTERPFIPRNNSFGMTQWVKYFLKDYDAYVEHNSSPYLIHAHTYIGGYIAHKIKEKTGIPYIVTLHETAILDNHVPRHHKTILKDALNNANQVIAVSEGLRNKIEDDFKVRSSVYHNFIDFTKFSGVRSVPQNFTFIYIGDLIPRKNVQLLIEAFSDLHQKHNGIKLKILGDGPEEHRLKSHVSSLGLKNSIQILGRLSQEEVAQELLQSSCLINPSKTETFGIVFVEALACGVPVISTPSVGPSDILNDKRGVLLSSFDQSEMVEAMEHMINHASDYKAEDLRRYAHSKFSSEKVIAEYKALYLKVLEEQT